MGTELPMGRAFLGAGVISGRLLAVGGYDPLNFDLATMTSFNHKGWAHAPAMDVTRAGLAGTACAGVFFAIGGGNSSVIGQSSVEAFNGSSWANAAALPATLDDLAAACGHDGSLYVLGGY